MTGGGLRCDGRRGRRCGGIGGVGAVEDFLEVGNAVAIKVAEGIGVDEGGDRGFEGVGDEGFR